MEAEPVAADSKNQSIAQIIYAENRVSAPRVNKNYNPLHDIFQTKKDLK